MLKPPKRFKRRPKLRITVVRDLATAEPDVRVGGLINYFPDDVVKRCERCLRTVYIRPRGPMNCTVYCIDCAHALDLFTGAENVTDVRSLEETMEWMLAEKSRKLDEDTLN